MRIAITPLYVKKAIILNHAKVVAIPSEKDELDDIEEDFALFDWNM